MGSGTPLARGECTGWSVQVVLELPVDDTAGGEKEDALTEMGFYVPKDAAGWGAGDQEHAAKVGTPGPVELCMRIAPKHAC